MIQFPETARIEWEVAADAALAEERLRSRIQHDTQVEHEVSRLRVRHEAALHFAQELDSESTPVLEMVTLADYKTNPAMSPVPMIEGVLNTNGTLLMLGPSGSGKSTLGLQMIYCLATGDDWLGQSVKPVMGCTGIMSYDMDAPLMLDWMSGFPSIDPAKFSVVNAYRRGNPLGIPAMRSHIAETWRAANTEVVMIDSFSASFFGHDQNDAASVQDHYRNLQRFALTEVGAKALIIVVHSTENSPHKARGSTVHQDVADAIVSMEGTGTEPRAVRMVKYRAPMGQRMMDPVVLTPPDDVTHLVGLDTGEMTMRGMHLPPSMVAQAFPVMPEAAEAPDTEVDEEDDL